MPAGIPSKQAAAALAWALKQVGVSEQPPGSNHGPLIDRWGRDCIGVAGGFPWCASFVWNAYAKGARVKLDIPWGGRPAAGRALVAAWVAWASAHGKIVTRPYRGDLGAMDWGPGPDPTPDDHIGIVVRVLALRPAKRFLLRTVEGNTGDAVRVRKRWLITGSDAAFIRI